MELAEAREILLQHARKPRNLFTEEIAEARPGECRNPICGDHVQVLVTLNEGGIETCRLRMRGCTMCTASASIMSELVQGRSVDFALGLFRDFEAALTASEGAWPAPELAVFSHLRINRSRIPCTLIGWIALKNALTS